MKKRLKFVFYDGFSPNLCSGTLTMELDGKIIKFPNYCLMSGGSVSFDDDGGEKVTDGPWTISKFPDGFPKELEAEAETLVNKNIPQGCCGGCV